MSSIDQFLKERFDALNAKFLEAYPNEAEGLYKYISWEILSVNGKSTLYWNDALLISLSDTFFQAEVRRIFQAVNQQE